MPQMSPAVTPQGLLCADLCPAHKSYVHILTPGTCECDPYEIGSNDLFSVAVTKHVSLGTLYRQEVYLAHSFGG
jgi:hypothetical protein